MVGLFVRLPRAVSQLSANLSCGLDLEGAVSTVAAGDVRAQEAVSPCSKGMYKRFCLYIS